MVHFGLIVLCIFPFWAGVLLVCFRQWNFLQLIFEQVPFVEKDNERGLSEEDIVEHVPKELFSLQHPVRCLVLPQNLVVVAQRDNEHDCKEDKWKEVEEKGKLACSDPLKAVNPSASLSSLPSHIHQLKFQLSVSLF